MKNTGKYIRTCLVTTCHLYCYCILQSLHWKCKEIILATTFSSLKIANNAQGEYQPESFTLPSIYDLTKTSLQHLRQFPFFFFFLREREVEGWT